MKKVSLFIVCFLVFTLGMGAMMFLPAPQPVSAAPLVVTRTPRSGEQINQQLAFSLQREQNLLTQQKIHLTRANEAAIKAQTLIDKAQAKGVDVTALNNALAAFKTQYAAAQASHDKAASILAAKNGFDANGQVTDAQTAHQTVVDARNALQEAHLTLQNGVLNLRSALQDWRIQHKQQ